METLDAKSDKLYDLALAKALESEEGQGKAFSSEELVSLGIVENNDKLMPVCQNLADSQLLRFLNFENKIHFALRTRDSAEK